MLKIYWQNITSHTLTSEALAASADQEFYRLGHAADFQDFPSSLILASN